MLKGRCRGCDVEEAGASVEYQVEEKYEGQWIFKDEGGVAGPLAGYDIGDDDGAGSGDLCFRQRGVFGVVSRAAHGGGERVGMVPGVFGGDRF